MRQPRNFATDRCCHLVSRIANRAFYLSAEAGGWRTTFLRFSPKGQGGRSRFAACSGLPVRTTSRRSTLRRCARRATLRRLARRIRIRLGRSTGSRRRGGGRLRMGRLLHHSLLHQRGQTLLLYRRRQGSVLDRCLAQRRRPPYICSRKNGRRDHPRSSRLNPQGDIGTPRIRQR